MKEVTIAVIGAGGRGSAHARRASQQPGVRIVAVADPSPERRARMGREFGIPPELRFDSWEQLANEDRVADAVIIGTQDALHRDPAIAMAQRGYHILIEKPLAPSEEDAVAIVDAVEDAGVMLMVAHVIRYTLHSQTLKTLIDSGRIGDVVSIEHLESVGYWHFAHSYVRGMWSNEARSSSMLMSKSCHDLDWLAYILGKRALRVSSFGGLYEFRPERRPAGAADRCLDCAIEPECAYSAKRFYLPLLEDDRGLGDFLWGLTEDITPDGVIQALREGPYGRCVYASDNDVADHQVVNVEFEDGVTASFTVGAFTDVVPRKSRILGTKGYIETDSETISVFDFLTETTELIDVKTDPYMEEGGGHGGADLGLITAFVSALRDEDPRANLSDARVSLMTHRMVWAAEKARHSGTVELVEY